MEELLKKYGEALEVYTEARKQAAEATIKYDTMRHAARVKLYGEKAAGRKITEEEIRSTTISDLAKEMEVYELALAAVDIAKESLEFYKTICRK